MYDRIAEWEKFNRQMVQHINTYTKEQYGSPDGQEQVDMFTVADCWVNMSRYFNRRHANTRGNKEKLRDLIKLAHYSQLAYDKLKAELEEPDVYQKLEPPRVFEPGLD